MERRRRALRLDSAPDHMTKTVRRREKPRERWLLTRKTWKYMADAGRRLVPDGTQNRPEDLPKIEAYFQEVCAREPRFLLWRKSSYPGAIPRPKKKKRTRGGSVRARSPSDEPPPPRLDPLVAHISGGRFDLAKLRRDFFATPPAPPPPVPTVTPEEEDDADLVDLLRNYLKLEDDRGPARLSESTEIFRALRRFLARQADRNTDDTSSAQRTLLETLGRYYGRSPNRDNIVQDLLTDRGLLKRLYHDLRKTKPYRGGRGGGDPHIPSTSGYRPRLPWTVAQTALDTVRSPPTSPPPLISVRASSPELRGVDCGCQTDPVPLDVLADLEKDYHDRNDTPSSPASPPNEKRSSAGRRRSSVDHDDVSQSVSDTIKRYLRMARKKSVDADKADRFKRVNYDKNLRNIKAKVTDVDDDGLHKGCQTDEAWILTYREGCFGSPPMSPTTVSPSTPTTPVSPPSPASPTTHQSFLSSLLGRTTPTNTSPSGGMQKSRSSSSVVQSVSKRLWRTRSRSSSRISTAAAASWTPQGSCLWTDGSGRCVRLADTSLLTLSDIERRALQQAALARLQQLNLGVIIKIPEENKSAPTSKPKRRAPLLKRKALTTGFFDQRSGKDSNDKDKESAGGNVFGVPLAQCVESERALRRQQHCGSRVSLASLSGTDKGDDTESCDSSEWGWSGLDEVSGGGPRVPALVSACLAHLRTHGLRTLGLFRVSASKKRVRQLREDWERTQEAALDSAACPHDVATLLKEFLRDLPDPLLCRDLYYAFLHTQKIRNRRLQWEALRLVIQLLPPAHRDTLNALLAFLAQLAAHSEDDRQPGNKMDAGNLATVFAPNILHRNKPNDSASAEQLSERADVINVVRTLIERQNELWWLEAELLHEAYIHLAHTEPKLLDALLMRKAESVSERLSSCATEDPEAENRRVWTREEFLHGGAATGGPDRDVPSRKLDKTYARTRRTRDAVSDTSSGSLSSAMTIVTSRVRSSVEESGVVCSPSSAAHSTGVSGRTDSAADSNDSASDYNEMLGNSDDDSFVITASLHIPLPSPRAPPPPPRRRSSSSVRDSAVGSSDASCASSPPTSPPPLNRQRPQDIDKLISYARERNTSDARAVILRQHDESTTRQRVRSDQIKTEHSRQEQTAMPRQRTRQDRQEATLYKRGELISSARPPP